MARYYVDTCIWRDYAEDRSDHYRPLGRWAWQFFRYIITQRHTVVWSALLLREIEGTRGEAGTTQVYKKLKAARLIEKVVPTPTQAEEADRLAEERDIPVLDAFHAIIARDAKAILVTRDAHFQLLHDVVQSQKPEEIF